MKNTEHRTPNIEHRMAVILRGHWALDVRRSMFNVLKSALIFAIRVYQLTISPAQFFLFGGNSGCRFTPTCSQYALDAVREHGALAGTILSAKRICRCHPWDGCGHDPVPKSGNRKAESGNILGHAHQQFHG